MESSTAPPIESSTPPEESPLVRRRSFWIGLIAVWLFTAGFLQFGLIDYLASPASERINDGDEGTFFAVHINPYFTFSEDFHLYVVRSQRIMDRGWTNALLYSTPDEQPNYSSPLQALLMMISVSTGGRPIPYSIFIFGVLTTSWSILYIAAVKWLPRSVSPLSILPAVLVTVLFESVDGILHIVNKDFAQWPVHRGLRMATLGWSNPLSMALLLAVISLLFYRQKPWGRIVFAAVVLSILAAADTWAFLLCAVCSGLVLATMGLMVVFGRGRLSDGARPMIVAGLGIGLGMVLAFAINLGTGSDWSGDVLTRAGFGSEWRDGSNSVAGTKTFYRVTRLEILILVALFALASIYGSIRISRSDRSLQTDLHLAWPSFERLYFLCLVANPMIALTTAIIILGRIGMNEYHGYQFMWRMEFMVLFALAVAVSEGVKYACRNFVQPQWRSTRWEIAISTCFVLSLFLYHNYRIYGFVSQTAAREFFLTKDEEELRDWLQSREPEKPYTLATASHELNYLCAYWTKADLLLPEGFPYHCAESDEAIETRMARLLALYGATPESWRAFAMHRHVWDQWSWGASRALSARHGYMYYLMHRKLLIEGNMADFPPPSYPVYTTPRLAEFNLNHDKRLVEGRYVAHKAGILVADQIAERLADLPPLTPEDKPDVIIVDEVSRVLGTPNLEGYRRDFQHGEIEAWVRTGPDE